MRGRQFSGFPTREQALEDFFAAWKPEEKTEVVPLEDAAWRVTARELYSKNTLPVYRTSACDGIAVRSADFANGMPDYTAWTRGVEYDRADTGDDFDDKFDAVIMIEEVDFAEDGSIAYISEDVTVSAGKRVMPAGSSLKRGDFVIGADMPLRPTDLAALAMSGYGAVSVRKRPRVAFIPTGSELISHRMTPSRGQNVDTNSILIRQQLLRMGAEPVIYPIIKDAPAELREMLTDAVASCDLVIINGGTAKGGEDFNTALLSELGTLIHHYISAAPGRPLAMAVIDGKPVVNIPGPTVAAFYCMDWCIRPVVNRFLHLPMPKRQTIKGVLTDDIETGEKMAILCRLNAERLADGSIELRPVSFRKDSTAACMTSNAMFVSPIGKSLHKKGEVIEAELLRGEEFIR